MYNGNSYVVSDLVNSYAWDTAIVFIQECSTKTKYAIQTRTSTSLYKTGTSSDVVCNIYDMNGNLMEYTTERSTYDGDKDPVPRGASYYWPNSYGNRVTTCERSDGFNNTDTDVRIRI